jgi:hypothetical protein
LIQTARNRSTDSDFLLVTHPFHPMAGQRVPILFQRRLKHGGLIYVCEGGPLGSAGLPESFTDRGLPPANGPLTVELLEELVALLKKIQEGPCLP